MKTPGCVGMVRDASERKGMEEKLRLQSAALEAAAIAFAITDLERTILWVNSAFTTLTGYTAEEAVGRNPRVLDASRPDLILLDLNLPKKDGREVLAEIKADEQFRRIPVVVLTTSCAENLDQFSAVVKAIGEFWFTIVRLPPE